MSNKVNLDSIGKDIEEILLGYVAVDSETATWKEKQVEGFLADYFGGIEYFKNNPNHSGAWPIPEDPLGRSVSWGMVKGKGSETVVLLHHSDVVGVEDFKTLSDLAFQPAELELELKKIAPELHPEAREDLLSGDYLFGRGVCDMKGGGAIQLALLARYSQVPDFAGNVIVLALPDEENLSAGMRSAVDLLVELSRKFDLHYVYTFNSEPHQRKKKEVGLLSEGTVGKLLAFVYVRGFLSHVGKVFEGLNPVALLSEIAVNTELSPLLSDAVGGEAAPPPTWLYLRDRKNQYDVSMPLGAVGCVSVLTLDSDPTSILKKLVEISIDSFATVVERMNLRYQSFCQKASRTFEPLPWVPSVTTYAQLYEEAYALHRESFASAYQEKAGDVADRIRDNSINFLEASFLLIEFVYNYIADLSPRVVVGFVPPYYPNVSNLLLPDLGQSQRELSQVLSDYCLEQYGQQYEREYYYTGISDLSYVALSGGARIKQELAGNTPLFGAAYDIPLEKIEAISMPCMNIGPWGKDFHKLTERVLKEDLYVRTPDLLNRAIQLQLEGR